MIPAHNHCDYLAETLRSVLAQDLGAVHMQLEVIDDASSEDVESVVRSIGKGRVDYFRQPRNIGQIGNFATCLQRSRGELVHLLHGDDLILPGFYEALEKGFATDVNIGAAFCRWQIIDARSQVTVVAKPEREGEGPLEDALARLASEQRIVTPAIAVRRSVYEQLGAFDPRLKCAEDWEMWVRIAAYYGIWYEPRVLAAYRQHEDSTTSRHFADAGELHYTLKAIKLFRPLLPKDQAAAIIRSARRAYAKTALDNARELAIRREHSAMRAHLGMALRLWPRPGTARQAARIALRLREA
jgi:glycosyltransferase involved in cell wall biosynthesis